MPSALSVGQIAGYSVAEPFGSLALKWELGRSSKILTISGMIIFAVPRV